MIPVSKFGGGVQISGKMIEVVLTPELRGTIVNHSWLSIKKQASYSMQVGRLSITSHGDFVTSFVVE